MTNKDYKRLTIWNQELQRPSMSADSSNEQIVDIVARHVDRLYELENAIENGTLVELPYKLGTKLYFIVLHNFGGYFEIFETEFWVYVSRYKDEFGGVDFAIEINDVDFDYETWVVAHYYSTKAEAEAKLEELIGDN